MTESITVNFNMENPVEANLYNELMNNFPNPEAFVKFAIHEIFYIVQETSENLADPLDVLMES